MKTRVWDLVGCGYRLKVRHPIFCYEEKLSRIAEIGNITFKKSTVLGNPHVSVSLDVAIVEHCFGKYPTNDAWYDNLFPCLYPDFPLAICAVPVFPAIL